MKLSTKYGIILGSASIGWYLLELILANIFQLFALSTITSIAALFIPLVILTIALKKKKKQLEVFQVQDALKLGFSISFIAAAMVGIFLFILYSLFPQVVNPYLDYIRGELSTSQSPEELSATIETLRGQFSAVNQAVISFISTLLTGTAVSWLLGKVMKTKFKHTEISATPDQ